MKGSLFQASLLFSMALASACVSSLTPRGAGVVLTFDRRDVEGCQLINNFSGHVFSGAALHNSRAELRNVAGSHGANAVLVTGEVSNRGSTSFGEGYACDPTMPAATAAPAAIGGCSKDTECKGDRICRDGVCVDPSP